MREPAGDRHRRFVWGILPPSSYAEESQMRSGEGQFFPALCPIS